MPTSDHRVDAQSHRLALDGEWTLLDFGEVPRLYLQVYSLLYSFRLIRSEDEDRVERARHAFQAYPWRGGYSAVNFYESLRYATPPEDRPTIRSIRYSSPGWIDLELCVEVAKQVATIVGAVTGSGLAVSGLYHRIYKQAQERKLLRVKVESQHLELAHRHRAFLVDSCKQLSEAMQFPQVAVLNQLAKDRLYSLKILMSLYRRVRDLGKYQNDGRIKY